MTYDCYVVPGVSPRALHKHSPVEQTRVRQGNEPALCLDIDLTSVIRQGVIERWEKLIAAQQRRSRR
jgi:hypothetical protein